MERSVKNALVLMPSKSKTSGFSGIGGFLFIIYLWNWGYFLTGFCFSMRLVLVLVFGFRSYAFVCYNVLYDNFGNSTLFGYYILVVDI